jgi:hypothetical protein
MIKAALSALSAIVRNGFQKPAQVLALSAVAATAAIPNFTEHIGKAIQQVSGATVGATEAVEGFLNLSNASFEGGANIIANGTAKGGRAAVGFTNTEKFFGLGPPK